VSKSRNREKCFVMHKDGGIVRNFYIVTLTMAAVSTSETAVNIYQTTQWYILDNSNFFSYVTMFHLQIDIKEHFLQTVILKSKYVYP
jgi:hypothetical protein